jgi:hypothetical protein
LKQVAEKVVIVTLPVTVAAQLLISNHSPFYALQPGFCPARFSGERLYLQPENRSLWDCEKIPMDKTFLVQNVRAWFTLQE